MMCKSFGNYPATPHLLRHRPAHVQAAHFAGLFLASGALLNSFTVRWFSFIFGIIMDSYIFRLVVLYLILLQMKLRL